MEKITLTEKQINEGDASKIIVADGDGQGDVHIRTLEELHKIFGYDTNEPYMTSLQNLWDDVGGNMVEIGIIQNGNFYKVNVE